jgi:uncharacterized protein
VRGAAGDPSDRGKDNGYSAPEAREGTENVYVGALTLDVLLGDVRSLKQKRSAVRPLIAEVNRRFPGASVAETGHLDLHRRAEIGIAVAASTAAHATQVLDACERFVAGRPDIELLSARQRLFSEEE